MIPFGDAALRFDLPRGVDRARLLADLRASAGVVDVILAEEVGAVTFDGAPPIDAVRSALEASRSAMALTASREHVIRVAYDGADLDAIAGLSRSDVVALHTAREYVVASLGFMPGFAYLRGIDPRLVVPRRANPRTRVPAGSVAIAANYTGIYPFASPGGWHLLGTALDFAPFDDAGATFAIGDRVRFESAAGTRATSREAALVTPTGPHLEVVKVAGLAIAVDAGRFGHMHEGIAESGALVPEALARANAALGNPQGACAVEIVGSLEVVARGGSIAIADDTNGATILEENASHRLTTERDRRVGYFAIAGGFDVPIVLGSRSTLLVAGLGGFAGRGLRRGDRIAGASHAARIEALSKAKVDEEPIPFIVGPDRAPDETLARILDATFRVSAASDRVGTRLEGPPLVTDVPRAIAAPMIRGAIELTPSGLIVLGPDHPTTGGYPVIGVVRTSAIGRLFARPIGAAVRLEAC